MARLFKKKEEGKKSLWERIMDVALTDVTVLARGGMDEGSLERLEELLIAADFGVPATLRLVDVGGDGCAERGRGALAARTSCDAVREEIVAILSAGRSDTALRFNFEGGPTVILVAGVNGVGKTTTIGKLAHRFTGAGPQGAHRRRRHLPRGRHRAAPALVRARRLRLRGGEPGPRPGRGGLRRHRGRASAGRATWCSSTPRAGCTRSTA